MIFFSSLFLLFKYYLCIPIQDLFNPNQKKKLKGNKLVYNSKNLNSMYTSLHCKPSISTELVDGMVTLGELRGSKDDAKKINYCIMLGLAWNGWAWLYLAGLADVLGRFGTFWGCLAHHLEVLE